MLLNKDGERYLKDYELGEPLDVHDSRHPQKRTMELGPRDRLSQAFAAEQRKGRTIEGKQGDYVHLDLRHLGEHRIDQRLPFIRELCRNYVGLDPVHKLIPVRPVVHYMMGGVHTDIQAATPLPSLFAAGECACVSINGINGANRLGSNSLPELLVFGRRAARAAAEFAGQHAELDEDALRAEAKKEQSRIRERYLQASNADGETVARLRSDLHEAMESGASIYREEPTIRQACDKIAELKQRLDRVRLMDQSLVFNTELTAAMELEFMIDVAESVLHGALARTESRGAHQRTDFPERDDRQFLKHSPRQQNSWVKYRLFAS